MKANLANYFMLFLQLLLMGWMRLVQGYQFPYIRMELFK